MDPNEKDILQIPESYFNNDDVEDMIRKHLDIVILCIIRNNSMSGQWIIKEIFYKYHVYISSSAVYPLLYSFRNQGILEIDTIKGDMRTKCYVPTEEGEKIINRRLNEFKEILEYFITCIDYSLSCDNFPPKKRKRL